MARRLSEEEQKQVLDKIKEQLRVEREKKYTNLVENIPEGQEEYYKSLVALFMEKDGINDKRDTTENAAFLKFVPVETSDPLTTEQIEKVANKLRKMGFVKKDDLIATYSTKARDDGEITLVDDMKKAIQGKSNAKKSILAKAKKMKEIFHERIETVKKEVTQIDKEIERLQEDKTKFTEQLANLDAPKVKQEIQDSATGKTRIVTNSDTAKQIEDKKASLNKAIEDIDNKIEQLTNKRREKGEEIARLEVQFGEIVARIERELRDKGMTLEQEENSPSVEARKSEDKKDEKDDKSNEGKTLTEKKRREQSVNKAKDIIYGINESLTKEEILEHIQEGRLDHFVEAKRKLYSSPAQMKIFDEKLRQILEKMALEDGIETIHMQGTNINIVKHRKLGKDKIRRHFR